MVNRVIPVLLIGLLAVLQGQLWSGRGSVSQVANMKKALVELERSNQAARLRNDQVANEVRDLQEGLGMIEELARQDLGMVKPNEIFVQIAQPSR